jgi:hypothetical protein
MLLTAILDHVMQQAGDGLILVAAIVEDERADPQEVREVGDVRALAQLAVVVARGVVEGGGEAGEGGQG